jgi:NADPH-dependent 2,4-dienoyl-CoA reductase/sulfur reductase-like enzyme
MHFLIMGGSDAGISAALRARELDRSVAITVVLADAFTDYSIAACLSTLVGRHPIGVLSLIEQNLKVLSCYRITSQRTWMRAQKRFRSSTALAYDRLLIATGARPAESLIAGSDLDGVHFVHTMGDGFLLQVVSMSTS